MTFWTRIEQLLKHKLLAAIESRVDRGRLQPADVDRSAIQNVLIVRQHDYLGDYLLATPVLRALREGLPNAKISLLVRSYACDVAARNRYVDEVIVFEEHGRNWTWRKLVTFWQHWRQGFDLAVVLNTVSHSLTSDVMARYSGARYVLGSEHRVFGGCRRNFLYDLEAPLRAGKRHQTERNLDIVRYLGFDTNDRSQHMTMTEQDVEFATSFLSQNLDRHDRKTVLLHLGAGKLANRWPVQNFVQLAVWCREKRDLNVIVAWGPQEKTLGDEFLQRLDFRPAVLEGVSLRQFAAVTSHADAFVCNDTGVMHVGAAAGTPLVAVFGPTDPEEWKPIGEQFIALRGEQNDCRNVSCEAVYDALSRLLQQGDRSAVQPSPGDLAQTIGTRF